ncbi:1-acyl-sn-glycerol-3-phosphate acyltransferase [Arenimonas sp.]|nr:1-acyl-sn-glycerol-3-phosphate acyltransferase [Candidatus Parcubacteria bacterium]
MKSHQKRTAISHYILKNIARPFIKTLWVKKVTGIENIPKKGAFIIAMNHQSFFDFLIFSAIAPRNVHFLAAEKFYKNRSWKALMVLTGQIKVERETKDKTELHNHVKTHLGKGLLLGIFPEGTRSPHKDEMLKAFNGISKYAINHKVNIIPVGLKGMYDILPKNSRKISFKKTAEVHIGKPIDVSEHWEGESDDEKYTYITEKVMKKIELLSGKKYNHYTHNHAE